MTKTRALIGVGVVILMALVAGILWLEFTRVCTRMGCKNTVGYWIPKEAYETWGVGPEAPLVVETCVDEDCRTLEVTRYDKGGCCRIEGDLSVVDDAFNPNTEFLVTLKVADSHGMVRYARTDSGAKLEKTQPNGPYCSPTWFGWYMELTPEDLGL